MRMKLRQFLQAISQPPTGVVFETRKKNVAKLYHAQLCLNYSSDLSTKIHTKQLIEK